MDATIAHVLLALADEPDISLAESGRLLGVPASTVQRLVADPDRFTVPAYRCKCCGHTVTTARCQICHVRRIAQSRPRPAIQ